MDTTEGKPVVTRSFQWRIIMIIQGNQILKTLANTEENQL